MKVLGAGILVLAAYWIPGNAVFSLLQWKGLSRPVRWLLPIPLAQIAVPLFFVAVSWLHPIHATLLGLLLFSGLVYACGLLLRWRSGQPIFAFHSRSRNSSPRWEQIGVPLFLGAFALLVMIPRIPMLIRGDQVSSALVSDIYYNLAGVTSVARSGLPPRNYLFPDLPYAFYYFSWIYPAILGSWPLQGLELVRTLNLHDLVGLATFLALAYGFLRANLSSVGARLIGLVFLTLTGGYGFFASPGPSFHQWWQTSVPFLVSEVQISSFLENYLWAPEHIAAAMAFLLCLFLWRNTRAPAVLRWVMIALLAAFAFGSSSFVFVSGAVAALIWVLIYRKVVFRWRTLGWIALSAAIFLAIVGPQIRINLGMGGALSWAGFRVVLTESFFRGANPVAAVLDQGITLAALPLVAAWLLLIDMGLALVLYVIFIWRQVRHPGPPWERFLALFPVAYLPIAILVLIPAFSMRGLIPAQIAMILAGCLVIDRFRWTSLSAGAKVLVGYGLALAILSQCITPWVDWALLARRGLADALHPVQGWVALPGLGGPSSGLGGHSLIPTAESAQPSVAYIAWANRKTPEDALFVEQDIAHVPDQFHFLERMQFADPGDVIQQQDGSRDMKIPGQFQGAEQWWQSLGPGTLLERARRSEYVQSLDPPLYYVSRSGPASGMGNPVYQDKFVVIYRLGP
ncbi:MAG: hypothetical protein ABSG98_04490 [Anaerolineales bacterium]